MAMKFLERLGISSKTVECQDKGIALKIRMSQNLFGGMLIVFLDIQGDLFINRSFLKKEENGIQNK